MNKLEASPGNQKQQIWERKPVILAGKLYEEQVIEYRHWLPRFGMFKNN